MKKLVAILGLVFLLVGGIAFNAAAIPIIGDVSFSGGITPIPADLATATSLTFSGTTVVTAPAPTGDFAGSGGTPVGVAPYSITPFAPIIGWWTFNFGGHSFTFDALTQTSVGRPTGFLNITGTGLMHDTLTGKDDTDYLYTITVTGTGTFGGSISHNPVPEPATLIMLGSALIGLIAVRRKVRR